MLRDVALTFFTKEVKPVVDAFDSSCEMLSTRFHSRSRQMPIKAKLISLILQQFHKDNQALDIALTKISSYIQKNFPFVPTAYQCEDGNIDILMRAVRLQTWAETAIQSLQNNETTYESFLAKLSYGLQTYIDTQCLRGTPSPSPDEAPMSVNFHRHHARYGNPRFCSPRS